MEKNKTGTTQGIYELFQNMTNMHSFHMLAWLKHAAHLWAWDEKSEQIIFPISSKHLHMLSSF